MQQREQQQNTSSARSSSNNQAARLRLHSSVAVTSPATNLYRYDEAEFDERLEDAELRSQSEQRRSWERITQPDDGDERQQPPLPSPPQQQHEVASVHFMEDDRHHHYSRHSTTSQRQNWEDEEDEQQHYRQLYGRRTAQLERYDEEDDQWAEGEREMAVDYSANDFRSSFAAIDAASRDRVRVRQDGDTTVVTEHRDPYSFYWQLDQARRPQEDPPRQRPPHDYVIDEEEQPPETVLSPHSHDSGVALVEPIAAPPISHYERPRPQSPPHRQLPTGWEKHQDPSGFSYYWHVDSGTIQRDPPRVSNRPEIPPSPEPIEQLPYRPINLTPENDNPSRSLEFSDAFLQRDSAVQVDTPSPPQEREVVLQVIQLPPEQPVIEEHAWKQITTKRQIERDEESDEDGGIEDEAYPKAGERGEEEGREKLQTVRFAVRSLGWTEIDEADLTADRSSRAVNQAIKQLSSGRGSTLDSVAKWGDGRELLLEIDDHELRLLDPDTLQTVHAERVPYIRVWGVGRDNARDFAYVARERGGSAGEPRRFLCHVFRCDTPAKTVANALRDVCRRLMMGRQQQQQQLAIEPPVRRRVSGQSSSAQSVDEPRKVVRCHFLGVTQVPRATGIDVLNEAVDRLVSQVEPSRWILTDVSVAPSTIAISEADSNLAATPIATCRVRYLSFLGIGRDVKHCAFIMHTSGDSYMCYVFHAEPSAAALAKTIEAACKLRYQKVLDAHQNRLPPASLNNSFAH